MTSEQGFTPDELARIADQEFFRAKAHVTMKVRRTLEALHAVFQKELAGAELVTPPGFDLTRCQFVKGEHLEDFPYQYLDFPKHFIGRDKLTFRSLFWWGHHFVFALILEGEGLSRYKSNFLNRFQTIAGRQLSLCLSPSLWEWKRGEGYTLALTPERRSQVAAVLSSRSSFKVARFIPYDDAAVRNGRLVEVGREALRGVLPIITP